MNVSPLPSPSAHFAFSPFDRAPLVAQAEAEVQEEERAERASSSGSSYPATAAGSASASASASVSLASRRSPAPAPAAQGAVAEEAPASRRSSVALEFRPRPSPNGKAAHAPRPRHHQRGSSSSFADSVPSSVSVPVSSKASMASFHPEPSSSSPMVVVEQCESSQATAMVSARRDSVRRRLEGRLGEGARDSLISGVAGEEGEGYYTADDDESQSSSPVSARGSRGGVVKPREEGSHGEDVGVEEEGGDDDKELPGSWDYKPRSSWPSRVQAQVGRKKANPLSSIALTNVHCLCRTRRPRRPAPKP